MIQTKEMEPKELLDELKDFSEKKNSTEPGYITFVLSQNTNIQNEINFIKSHMADKFRPQIKSANKGAKKLIKILQGMDEEELSDTPILYLLDGNDCWAYSLPLEEEGTHRPTADHKFEIDWLISKLEDVVKKEKRKKEKKNLERFRKDYRRYESEEIDIYPGITEVKRILNNNAGNVDKIYILDDFEEDDDLNYISDLALKTGKEMIELGDCEKLENLGSIAAVSYYKDERSLSDENDRIFKRIKDSKRFFNFYEKNLLDAYGKVEDVEEFVREEMQRLDQKIYYVVGQRGDGKTQSIQYIIRKYLKKLDELRYFPVDCRLKIELDKNQNNIINFWKYVKVSFQNMKSNIKKDEELYKEIKDVSFGDTTFGELLTYLEEEMDDHQKEKKMDDEEYVWKLIESLNNLGFNGILLFVDELDKPDFESVVKNFLNHNQHLFTKLFENNCSTFICAKPDWFEHIHEDSDLNFYTGGKLQIKPVISVEQCRSLIEKRFEAFDMKPPLHLPDEGYRIILQTGKRRRQIIEKYIELLSYSEKEGKSSLSLDEIKSVLTTIDPQTKDLMIKEIENSKNLYDLCEQIYKSGETYLDAIDFVFRKGDGMNLHYIEDKTKINLIDRKLEENGFEIQEFRESWDWMNGVGIIDNQGEIDEEFEDFLNTVLSELGGEEDIETLYTVQDILREIIGFFEKEATSTYTEQDDQIVQDVLPSEEEISEKAKYLVDQLTGTYERKKEYRKQLNELSKESQNREGLKEKLKEMVITSKTRDGYRVRKKYPHVDTEQHRTLEKDWMLQLYSDLNQKKEDSEKDEEALFKELQEMARKEILKGLTDIFEEHNLGNLAFNYEGLLNSFDQLDEKEKQTLKHFFDPPNYMKSGGFVELVYDLLKIIHRLDENLTFSPSSFLDEEFRFEPVQQYNEFRSLFKEGETGKNLVDEFYRSGKDYIINRGSLFEEEDIKPLLDKGFLQKGSLKECSKCKNEVIISENAPDAYHPSCDDGLSEFNEKNEVFYITDPEDIDLLFLLRFIFETDVFEKVILNPKYDDEKIHVDAICLKERKMIGLKTVSSAKEVGKTEKLFPDILSRMWYIETQEIKGDPGDVVFVPTSEDYSEWAYSRIKEESNVSARKIKKFLQG